MISLRERERDGERERHTRTDPTVRKREIEGERAGEGGERRGIWKH